jgi:hypothetical protein
MLATRITSTQITKLAWIMVFFGIITLLFLTIFSSLFSIDKIGILGDSIGGISGSIWSLSGVLFFYSTLISQEEERFKSHFFTLLTIFEKNKSKFLYKGASDYQAFQQFTKELTDIQISSSDQENKIIHKTVKSMFERSEADTNPLALSILFELVKMILTLSKSNRQHFVSVLRSTLSEDEKIYLHNKLTHSSYKKKPNELEILVITHLNLRSKYCLYTHKKSEQISINPNFGKG